MTADALSFVQWFFPFVWRFFTSWYVPGTGMTPASWLFFLLLSGLVLTIIPKLLGFSWFGER